MDQPLPHARDGAVLDIAAPREPRSALVAASPHSGLDYAPRFLAQSVLDALALRRSEDSFVDELFGSAPSHGAPLLKALFPRAYLDVNREPYELDPGMFEGTLPSYANTASPRVSAGLGTIPRVVATGANIYGARIPVAEALQRIEDFYFPYHAALAGLVAETKARFGYCLLIDCHSMPSIGGPTDTDHGTLRFDMVLGDCHGTTAAAALTDAAERVLTGQGYRVVRNAPYAGGHTTQHYGRPGQGVHALQIEINRSLYMDEATHRRSPDFSRLEQHMSQLLAALAALPAREFRP